MEEYHINIFYSEEDEGIIADIPDLEVLLCFWSDAGKSAARGIDGKESVA